MHVLSVQFVGVATMTEVKFVTTGNERQRAQFHLLPVSFVYDSFDTQTNFCVCLCDCVRERMFVCVIICFVFYGAT